MITAFYLTHNWQRSQQFTESLHDSKLTRRNAIKIEIQKWSAEVAIEDEMSAASRTNSRILRYKPDTSETHEFINKNPGLSPIHKQ